MRVRFGVALLAAALVATALSTPALARDVSAVSAAPALAAAPAVSAPPAETATPSVSAAPAASVVTKPSTGPARTPATSTGPAAYGLLTRPSSSGPALAGTVIGSFRGLISRGSTTSPYVGPELPTTRPSDTIAAAEPTAGASAARRVLVILEYDSQFHKDSTTQAQAAAVIAQDDKYYRAVSRGRVGFSATVTPWFGVSQTAADEGSLEPALAAARAHGYNPDAYDHVVFYRSGSCYGNVGLGEVPGRYVWIYGCLRYDVVGHELGHNLGFGHAGALSCTNAAARPVTIGGSCNRDEYGDLADIMAESRDNAGPGTLSADALYWRGWLTSSDVIGLSNSALVSIRPLESQAAGAKAVRIYVGNNTYLWVEYRVDASTDTTLTPSEFGVRILVSTYGTPSCVAYNGGCQTLIDMQPQRDDAWFLPVGSHWTSPEGVEVGLRSTTPTAANLSIQFHAPAPGKPAAPATVSVQPDNEALDVSWTRGADSGRPISQYVISYNAPGGLPHTYTVPGDEYSAQIGGLENDKSYVVTVAAVNDIGAGNGRGGTYRPHPQPPSVRLTVPAGGSTLHSGVVTLSAAATANPVTQSPVYQVNFFVGGEQIGSGQRTSAAGWTLTTDITNFLPSGQVAALSAQAQSQDGLYSAMSTIHVSVPIHHLTGGNVAPATGTSFPVDSSFVIGATVNPDGFTRSPINDVLVEITASGQTGWGYACDTPTIGSGARWRCTVSTSYPAGLYDVRVTGYDEQGYSYTFQYLTYHFH